MEFLASLEPPAAKPSNKRLGKVSAPSKKTSNGTASSPSSACNESETKTARCGEKSGKKHANDDEKKKNCGVSGVERYGDSNLPLTKHRFKGSFL